LWVKLQLETLRLARNEEGARTILQDLPKDLDETYERLLQRLAQSTSQELITRMFECMIAARRPLTMEELCEGMAFTLEDRRWDEKKVPVNDLNVLATYGGMVIFDERTRVVRLANFTVQQYLLRDRPKSCYQFNLKDANKHLGEVCIAYLCFEDFEEANSPIGNRKAIEEMISPISPVDNPNEIIFPKSIDIASITIGFRRSMPPPREPQQSEPTFENFGLHRYAKRNWLWHAARFVQTEKSDKRDSLFQNLVTQKQLPFEFKPWPADIFMGNPYPDQLGWAITHNNPSIIKSLSGYDQWFDFQKYIRDSVTWVFQDVVNNSLSGDQMQSIAYIQDSWNESLPMHGWVYSKMLIAARKGNLAILDLCRPDLDKQERPWNQFRAHLIVEAASANQKAVIDSFKLAQGPTIEQSRSFTTEYAGQLCNALERAALNGHADMVRRLGRAGWSAKNIFGSRTSAGVIALNNAVIGNNSDVVKSLLTALELTIYDPTQASSQKDSRLSIKAASFCKAASAGHVAVVKTFLEDGASAVAADESGMNAYMQAIKDGHMHIFNLLFPLPGCGVEGNSTGFPLALAAAHGHIKIVEFLISKGANVFQTEGLLYRTQGLDQKSKMPGPTPLYAASANGHYGIVERLLAAGAGADVISTKDVVQPVEGAGSARQRLYAPEQEPLAALGVIHPYQRPLCGAALNGHLRVVQLLLGAKATVNPADLSENSPLLLALIGGHAEVADLLSEKGAEIKNKESAEQALLACSICPDGTEALQLLIEYGISPDCTNFLGESSLHIATTAGLPDIMKFLMKVGVDINARDSTYIPGFCFPLSICPTNCGLFKVFPLRISWLICPGEIILTSTPRSAADTTHESLQQPKL
jgi:ankyrin repeat protein